MLRDETIRRGIQFRDDREWRQFHTPKDLAISLSLEAAELLEIFQWSGADLECRDKLGRIREELADVLSYCVLMADVCGLDLDRGHPGVLLDSVVGLGDGGDDLRDVEDDLRAVPLHDFHGTLRLSCRINLNCNISSKHCYHTTLDMG